MGPDRPVESHGLGFLRIEMIERGSGIWRRNASLVHRAGTVKLSNFNLLFGSELLGVAEMQLYVVESFSEMFSVRYGYSIMRRRFLSRKRKEVTIKDRSHSEFVSHKRKQKLDII